MKYFLLVFLFMLIGCQKAALQECHKEKDSLEATNQLLINWGKRECPKPKRVVIEVPAKKDCRQKVRAVEYKKGLYSRAWKECVRELKQCKEKK